MESILVAWTVGALPDWPPSDPDGWGVPVATFEIVPDGHGFILSGELDMAGAPEFAEAFAEVIHIGGPVTVDMRKLKFMDSSGIQTIIAAVKASGDDTCIVLHGVHDEVQKIVELTKINHFPNLHIMPCTIGVSSEDRAARA